MKKKQNYWISSYLLVLLFFSQIAYSQNLIIPKPVSFSETETSFVFEDGVVLYVASKNELPKKYAHQLYDNLMKAGIKLTKTEKAPKNSKKAIIIKLNKKDDKQIGLEGYTLGVDNNNIHLAANTPAGIYYGIQTIYQMLPAEVENGQKTSSSTISIKGCKIIDYPRFEWRGLMLDVSRHFFSVEDIKSYLDKMAKYKFNVFHWHLTDDEGWRIEIKSLPKLTDIGAWRVERTGRFGKNRATPKKGEKTTYGGYYNQEQIKDIVKYAMERNITIVPEIDMPGHSMAALAAYPELSVNKKPKYVNPGAKFAEWHDNGKFTMLIENTLNPADEKVYEFADKVFEEVAELFPGEYIHMGGDECYHGYWEKDAGVKKFMKKNKIKDGHELQNYFINRIKKIIESKGKKMIGWDEIIEGDLDAGSAVMSWRGMKGGVEAAKRGYKVVMSPTTFCYLDYTQGDHSVENSIYADLSLEKSYEFDPAPDTITNSHLIVGGQGNLWTEVIPNIQFAFYMTYPRALAISESLWSARESKNWNSFIERTLIHFERFDRAGTSISKAVLEPIVEAYKKDGKVMCKLKNNVPGVEIFYTIDNTYPVEYGLKYSTPFQIPPGEFILRTRSYQNGEAIGRELRIEKDKLLKRIKN